MTFVRAWCVAMLLSPVSGCGGGTSGGPDADTDGSAMGMDAATAQDGGSELDDAGRDPVDAETPDAGCTDCVDAGPRDPVNVVLIIADDMGLDATPWHPDVGGAKPNMPNVSRLAREGLVFDHAYAGPVCTVTRGTAITGKYPFRTGITHVTGPRNPSGGIRPGEVTLQRLISRRSDTRVPTAIIGKWHLLDDSGTLDEPERMTGAFYAGLLSGRHADYYDWPMTSRGEQRRIHEYSTTWFTNRARTWVDSRGDDSPWFLWLAYTAPHDPFQKPPPRLHTRTDLPNNCEDAPRKCYLAMLEALDTEVGRLLNRLPANTIVIFIADNGSAPRMARGPVDGNRAKGTLFEGGIRVPLVVWGPGVRRGRTDAFVTATDLFATIASLVGVPLDTHHDSISFAPLLFADVPGVRDRVYMEMDGGRLQYMESGWSLRDARYKWIWRKYRAERCFDLQADPWERSPLDNASAPCLRLRDEGRALRGE